MWKVRNKIFLGRKRALYPKYTFTKMNQREKRIKALLETFKIIKPVVSEPKEKR